MTASVQGNIVLSSPDSIAFILTSCVFLFVFKYLSNYLPTCLHTYTYLFSHLPTYLPTYLPCLRYRKDIHYYDLIGPKAVKKFLRT